MFFQVQVKPNYLSDSCSHLPFIFKKVHWTIKWLIWCCFLLLTNWAFRIIYTFILWLINFKFFSMVKNHFPEMLYILFSRVILHLWSRCCILQYHTDFTTTFVSLFYLSNAVVLSSATNFMEVLSLLFPLLLLKKMFHNVCCGKIIP